MNEKTKKTRFKVNDQVIVPAAVNGYGMDIVARVDDVELFANRVYVSVSFLNPCPDGRRGGCYFQEQLLLVWFVG